MKHIIPFLILLSICSCENILESSGFIYDASTDKPLDSVIVKTYVIDGSKRQYHSEMLTDSTGLYTAASRLVGCVPECPDLAVEFIKDGYGTLELVNPNRGEKVYLFK